MQNKNGYIRKPAWLKSKIPTGDNVKRIAKKLKDLKLYTVCEEAKCPNRHECWSQKTATMMILGGVCTRGCRFCDVQTGNPKGIIDTGEIDSAIKLVETMDLDFIVITSVDRDDLDDFGATHFANVVGAIKNKYSHIKIEVLIPDFNVNEKSMHILANSKPFVIAHNIETVRRLSQSVRDKRAGYQKSLDVLNFFKLNYPEVATKSSIMVGLGESDEEIIKTMQDLREVGCAILTIGQYLRPSKKSLEVVRYYEPSEFDKLKEQASKIGFTFVSSGPLVRSSYKANEYLQFLDQK